MAQAVVNEHQPLHGGRSEYRLYLIAFFPLFLAVALIARLAPSRTPRARRPSIFHDAADRAHSIIPWIFSGR